MDDFSSRPVGAARVGAPYVASGQSSPKGSPKGSKHMNTIKSLSLLHDLKEYITKVENTAAEQQHELERVKGGSIQEQRVSNGRRETCSHS